MCFLPLNTKCLTDSLKARERRPWDLVPLPLRLHPSQTKTCCSIQTALPCISEMRAITQASISAGLPGAWAVLLHLSLAPFFLGWAQVQGQASASTQKWSPIKKDTSEQSNATMGCFQCLWCKSLPPKNREFMPENQRIFQGWLKLLNTQLLKCYKQID